MNYELISFLIKNTPSNGLILDAGCGDCYYSSLLKKKNRMIVSLDVHIANRSQREGVNFILGSLEYLPLKQNIFDFIFCLSVIQLINDDKSVMKEVHRVLKPEGIFFFTVPTQKSMFKVIRELEIFFGTYKLQQYNVQHHHYYTRRKICELTEGLFQIKKISGYDYNFFPRLFFFICDLSHIRYLFREIYNGYYKLKLCERKTEPNNDSKRVYQNNNIRRKGYSFNKCLFNHWIFFNFAYHYIIVLKKE